MVHGFWNESASTSGSDSEGSSEGSLMHTVYMYTVLSRAHSAEPCTQC